MGWVIFAIVFSFLVHCICYVYVSKSESSFLNVFFPIMLSNIPINFFFEPLYIYYYGLAGSVYSYIYIYTCYTAMILFTTIGYVFTSKQYTLVLPFSKIPPISSTLGWLLILGGFITYLPVLVEFREYIFTPREIYTHTRTGYGIYFFVSTFLTLVGYFVMLFSKNATSIKILLLSIFVVVFLYLHGSKGQVTLLFTIVSLYYVYIKNWHVSLKMFAYIAVGISMAVVLLFYLTSNYEYDSLLKLMVGYSDYNRNAMMIIDKQKTFYHGQLTFESNFYSRIPRALMPSKPKDFGSFKLSEIYYPEWFDNDTGSPSFGLGVQYADFGNWAIAYLSAWALALGFLLRVFIQRVKKYRTPGDFIISLFIVGVTLLPLGDGFLLPEHLLVGLGLNMLLCIRVNKSSALAKNN